ncbi:unnamed protein product [Boreogadus saida]
MAHYPPGEPPSFTSLPHTTPPPPPPLPSPSFPLRRLRLSSLRLEPRSLFRQTEGDPSRTIQNTRRKGWLVQSWSKHSYSSLALAHCNGQVHTPFCKAILATSTDNQSFTTQLTDRSLTTSARPVCSHSFPLRIKLKPHFVPVIVSKALLCV